jgi:hypothetical protein
MLWRSKIFDAEKRNENATGKNDNMSAERLLPGLKNRILQMLARIAPGATTLRVSLNRWRGVNSERTCGSDMTS